MPLQYSKTSSFQSLNLTLKTCHYTSTSCQTRKKNLLGHGAHKHAGHTALFIVNCLFSRPHIMVSGGMVSAESRLHPAPMTQWLLMAVTLLTRATITGRKSMDGMLTPHDCVHQNCTQVHAFA